MRVRFLETPLAGLTVVAPSPIEDTRGFFARMVCTKSFSEFGLDGAFVQSSVSFNRRKGTLRGLHYQREPFAEDKLVRVTAGAIWDVAVDLRPGSPTFRRWHAIQLDAANRLALYVPKGFAHGFCTLEDDTEILYQMTVPYVPGHAAGIRWNDPTLAVRWPVDDPILSESDTALPLVDP
jgi:dTDP-4-dehydrorhamnose 3,5-epimerase